MLLASATDGKGQQTSNALQFSHKIKAEYSFIRKKIIILDALFLDQQLCSNIATRTTCAVQSTRSDHEFNRETIDQLYQKRQTSSAVSTDFDEKRLLDVVFGSG